jgi:hypothetical protein
VVTDRPPTASIPRILRRSMTPDEWLAAYRTAWIERDPEAAAALFTADSTYLEQPYDEAFVGPQGVRD